MGQIVFVKREAIWERKPISRAARTRSPGLKMCALLLSPNEFDSNLLLNFRFYKWRVKANRWDQI